MERTKNINKDSLKKDILWFCGKVIAPNPKPNVDMAKKEKLG
jgi:hypothetical protein